MLSHHYLPDPGVVVLTCAEPFELSEILGFLKDLDQAAGQGAANAPLLCDLRWIDLSRLSGAQIRDHALRRSRMTQGRLRNFVSYITRDDVGLGMIRMYSLLTDAWNTRDEDRTHVDRDPDGAARWLCRAIGADDTALQRLLAALHLQAPERRPEPSLG